MKTVRQLCGLRAVAGEVGVEIEVEGRGLPYVGESKFWRAEADGSLRGESIEYVLQKPLPLGVVKEALDELSKEYKKAGAKVNEPFRAGTHVHLNCQHLNLVELFNFITLYLIFETLLIKGCGENRRGNLFCLSSSEAEFWLSALRASLKNVSKFKDIRYFTQFIGHDNDIRYASLNLNAIRKYGSLEFRAMKSTPKMNEIYDWVLVLHTLQQVSKKFKTPTQIVVEFSANGVDKFMSDCLGEFAKKYSVLPGDYKSDMFAGMRNAQEIAYAIDWKVVEEITCDEPEKQAVKPPEERRIEVKKPEEFNKFKLGRLNR